MSRVWNRCSSFELVFLLVCVTLGLLSGMAIESAGLVVLGIGCLILVYWAFERPQLFSGVIVLSTFASRFAFDVSDLRIRAEMCVGIVCGVALLAGSKKPIRREAAAALGLLFAWVFWLVFVSAFTSPELLSSANIIVWLVLDLLMVIYVLTRVESTRVMVTCGLYGALTVGLAGISLWSLATLGGPKLLVQPDPAYGGFAAYVTLFEANILAGACLLWAIVALSETLSGHVLSWVRVALVVISPVVALVTHTRIALVGSAIIVIYGFVRVSKFRWPILWFLLPSCVLIFGVSNLSALELEKFANPISLEEGTGQYRSAMWSQALHDLSGGFLSGLGANSFGQRHLDPSLPGSGARWYLGNLPLQIVYDGGVVAVILVSVAVLIMMVRVRSEIATLFLVVYLLLGIATSTLWLMQSWVFVAIALLSVNACEMRVFGVSSDISTDRVSGRC